MALDAIVMRMACESVELKAKALQTALGARGSVGVGLCSALQPRSVARPRSGPALAWGGAGSLFHGYAAL